MQQSNINNWQFGDVYANNWKGGSGFDIITFPLTYSGTSVGHVVIGLHNNVLRWTDTFKICGEPFSNSYMINFLS